MLLLFETPAGFAIFKVLDEAKLRSCDDLFRDFETPEGASKVVKLKHFSKFADMTDALAATTAAVEGKLSKGLRKVLKKAFSSEVQEQLAVADSKLGSAIKEKLNIGCVHDSSIAELMRCVRSQFNNLVSGLPQSEMNTMALGLAHSLSRYKLKFSPDKVDTMIVQAISLLDDLDKELNNYTMRCREWYGWHFPELGKIVTDNMAYARTVKTIGIRAGIAEVDLSSVLPEEVEAEVREVAEVSMGTEISNEDIENIIHLCNQIIELSEYRTQLYDYLKNRMMAIAPNLTLMVGELVGARLVAHAGSLLNLAKHPSSTVQILGAEKALFRALKTKHDTPKYGLIYHASFVGQTAPKNKGKISRMLAAKASLCARVDALGEDTEPSIGIESKAKMEARLATCDRLTRISGTGKAKAREEKYQMKSTPKQYNPGSDFTFDSSAKRKRKAQDTDGDEATPVAKKVKKEKKLEQLDESVPVVSPAVSKKVKKEKKDEEQLDESLAEASPTKKVKKEKKRKHPDLEDETLPETSPSPVKKKKKKSLA